MQCHLALGGFAILIVSFWGNKDVLVALIVGWIVELQDN